jgi:hypothetical protein
MANIVSFVSESGNDKSFAAIKQTLQLHSYHATQIVNRVLAKTGDALFNISVSLRAIADQDLVDEVSEVIDGEFSKVQSDLEKHKDRARVVLEQSGVKALVEYSNITTYEIQVNSPQMMMLLRLLRSLDELNNLNDTLWMNGLCTDKEKSKMSYDWQRRFTKMCNRIIEIHKRARKAHNAKNQEDASNEPTPSSDVDNSALDAAELADGKKESVEASDPLEKESEVVAETPESEVA